MGVDPDAVASAVLSCPQVARLSSGTTVEAATYLPGRRVTGVRVTEDEVAIHIVARWGPPLPEVADAVRKAVGPVTAGLPTSVVVEDIDLPGDATAPGPTVTSGAGGGGGASP